MAKYLILIILCFTYQVNGQKAKTDSLKKVLVDTYEDSARMEICYYLSTLYKNNNYDSALIYSEKAYNLAQKVETQTKLIQYRRQVASILRLAGAYPEAQQLFLQNMEDASQSADSMTIRLAHQDLGSVFINLGDFDSATVHLVKAAELAADMGDLDAQAKSYGNLGMTLITHNDLKKALMYLQKSLDIYQEIENNVQVSACLLKISRVFVAQHNYEKALEYDLRALEIAKNTNHKSLLSIVYGELSSTNLDLRRLEAAKKYAELSLAIKREMNNKRGISASLYTLGGINLEQKNYQEALDKLLESQLLLEEMGAKEQIMIGLKTISKTYEELGDYKKAYTYFYNYSIMRDSIINETTAKQIADTETRYNVKEKEAKLEIQETQLELQKIQLTNQKILIASVVFLTTFLIVLLVFARKNIIQRKKINEQLNELDKSKSRFFTNVTHEIRTPLTLILAPLQNLLDKCTDQSTLQDLLLIKSNSKKLLTFLDEILQLSKLDSGKIIINNITLNLYEFCKRLFYAYQSLAQFRQIDYKFNFMLDKNISVEVDQGKLEVILNNLLSNAFKFSVSGSTISLIISQKDKKLLFFVSDTGQGIHPDDLPKIFMRYYQTSRKEKMANGGAGIGLSLAKEYSKLMGGGITVESEQGKGSRFIL
ncbi:MAG: tetratricopeptide repeat-containing sensor histidine kinase, partial [Prolixibacteraceae bacterium]|nr:tetratricopeptide repeat-containing sensor histidine kinase [Prolixibacteraceae bacterium]